MSQKEEKVNICSLNDDLLKVIMAYMDIPCFVSLSKTCKSWNIICSRNWKLIYGVNFMIPLFVKLETKVIAIDSSNEKKSSGKVDDKLFGSEDDDEDDDEEEGDDEDEEDDDKEEDGENEDDESEEKVKSEPKAKKKRIIRRKVLERYSREEREKKLREFMDYIDEDDEGIEQERIWYETTKLRYKLHRLNFKSVNHLLNDLSAEIDSMKESEACSYFNAVAQCKFEIHESWKQIRKESGKASKICLELMGKCLYYFGIYHMNATDGYEYKLDIEARSVFFRPDNGRPIFLSSSFRVSGSRGNEDMYCKWGYTDYTFDGDLKKTAIYKLPTICHWETRMKHQRHVFAKDKVKGRVRDISLFTSVKDTVELTKHLLHGQKESDLNKLLQEDLPNFFNFFIVACDPSYYCYY